MNASFEHHVPLKRMGFGRVLLRRPYRRRSNAILANRALTKIDKKPRTKQQLPSNFVRRTDQERATLDKDDAPIAQYENREPLDS